MCGSMMVLTGYYGENDKNIMIVRLFNGGGE
jgi:hypothetical protein